MVEVLTRFIHGESSPITKKALPNVNDLFSMIPLKLSST